MSSYKKKKSEFIYADGLTSEQLEYHSLVAHSVALSKAERNSLVKRSKSPTNEKPLDKPRDLSVYEPIREIEDLPDPFQVNSNGRAGLFTVIYYREWSGEYRVRTRVETSFLQPPLNLGKRESHMLTDRAARKITESCYYMAKRHGGYKTFVTGTFKESVREQIKFGETTIQKEVSRTMDSLQKMYKRGWITSSGERISGQESLLPYCWVVEIPLNAIGEENPHVHIMLGWDVPRELFDDWSKRIESIWGNGYFHLERIRDPLCAGAYIVKAAGYLIKAANQNDQGKVKGNRYGISAIARAPDWLKVTEAELGIMGKIINDVHETCMRKKQPLIDERTYLKETLLNFPKSDFKKRKVIGKRLQAVREKIASEPIVTSKYQLIFKNSEELLKFMARSLAKGWDMYFRPTSLWYSKIINKIKN